MMNGGKQAKKDIDETAPLLSKEIAEEKVISSSYGLYGGIPLVVYGIWSTRYLL